MIILASSSPARAKLLTDWGFDFKVIPTHIDEESDMQTIHDPDTLVTTLAEKKANSCLKTIKLSNDRATQRIIILAADTIVWINHQVIGKPADRNDARRIIKLLSGTTHQVWTGVCLLFSIQLSSYQAIKQIFAEKTSVTFASMTNREIETYLDTNDWVEKAGAYQIQKAIKPYVTAITGDINTVIGLPKKTTPFLNMSYTDFHQQ